jgi:hypothetical protein
MHLNRYAGRAAALVLGVSLAACEDAKNQPAVPPTAPTAPAEQSAMSPDMMPNAALELERNIASVCKAYRKASVQMKKDLIKTPDDTELQAQAKALKEMTDDACN